MSSTDRLQVHDRTFRPYIHRDEVHSMVQSIADEMNHAYAGTEVTFLVILNGAMVFACDLMRRMNIPVSVETLRASSYKSALYSNGQVAVEDIVPDLRKRHVVIVEDIIDTGHTMRELIKHVSSLEPASVAVATLLSKPDVHQGSIQIDYVGREIGPDFVVGYGMDYAGYGRHLDAIWIIDESTDNDETAL